jgi:hypothetical protein
VKLTLRVSERVKGDEGERRGSYPFQPVPTEFHDFLPLLSVPSANQAFGRMFTKDPFKSMETIGHRINTVTVEP